MASTSVKRRSDAVSSADIVRLRLQRLSTNAIAEQLGVGRQCITEALLRPEVIEEIEAADREALDIAKAALRGSTQEASEVLKRLMRSEDDRIALDAAKTVLTKAGADAPTKGEVKQEVTTPGGAIQIVVASADELRALAAPKLPTESE